jgi:hypothetical protein
MRKKKNNWNEIYFNKENIGAERITLEGQQVGKVTDKIFNTIFTNINQISFNDTSVISFITIDKENAKQLFKTNLLIFSVTTGNMNIKYKVFIKDNSKFPGVDNFKLYDGKSNGTILELTNAK